MSAQPLEPHGIEHNPQEILERLPERYRDRFLADYREAMVAAAHETWRWQHLAETLRIWHLRSLAYNAPGYAQARADAAAGIPGIPAEDVIPGWGDLIRERGGAG